MRKIAFTTILIFLCMFCNAQSLGVLKPGTKAFYISDNDDAKSKALLSSHTYFWIDDSTGTKRSIRTLPPENISGYVNASRIAEFDKLPVSEKKKHFVYVFDAYRKLLEGKNKNWDRRKDYSVYEAVRDKYVAYWIATKDPALQNKYFAVASLSAENSDSGEDKVGYAQMFLSSPDEFIRQLKKQPKAIKSSIVMGMEYGLMYAGPDEAKRKIYLEKLKKQL